jgi:hypothetical protein
MFEEERAHLKPLPLLGMQYFSEAERTVCDDSCVRVDHSSYAARPAAIGSKVLVRIYAQRIEIRDIHTRALLRTHAKATTILDRLMHSCAMLEFEGKSYRLKEAAARIAIKPEPS